VAVRPDFLIIGSGIAGLRAAVELAGAGTVLILTKAEPREGNTGYAQGGIAAAVDRDDSPDQHAADTLAAGDGLCDPGAVRVLCEEGPGYVRELIEWGARFNREADGTPALGLEAAHSRRRVLHTKDATGREIGRVLWARASSLPGIHISDHARAIEIITDGDGRCVGVRVLQEDGVTNVVGCALVLLATGGAGHVYSDTTNPLVATGDGIAMAFRAGAAVADLEFIQFHPTALHVPGHPRFLLSEALRGEGARLVNADGEAFMRSYDAAGDLAPRDRVARAAEQEARRTGRPIYLSLAHLDAGFVYARFPLISEVCRQAGFDLARDRIPVGPAAHYVMGGVRTDLDGRASVSGLFAAGEVACTGVHGANRLASNSLLEGLVFGARAGRAMRESVRTVATPADARASHRGPAVAPSLTASDIQALMWREVGLFRNRAGLTTAIDRLEPAWHTVHDALRGGATMAAEDWRTMSLLTVGRLIARAALRREESRGGHYRDDYPARDDIHWRRRLTDSLHVGSM